MTSLINTIKKKKLLISTFFCLLIPITLKAADKGDDANALYYAVKEGDTLDFYTKKGMDRRLGFFDNYLLKALSNKGFEEKNIVKSDPKKQKDKIVFQ
ncbi:MAG: hypothetical protein AAF335_03995, partial [Bacteroidota bacterium]